MPVPHSQQVCCDRVPGAGGHVRVKHFLSAFYGVTELIQEHRQVVIIICAQLLDCLSPINEVHDSIVVGEAKALVECELVVEALLLENSIHDCHDLNHHLVLSNIVTELEDTLDFTLSVVARQGFELQLLRLHSRLKDRAGVRHHAPGFVVVLVRDLQLVDVEHVVCAVLFLEHLSQQLGFAVNFYIIPGLDLLSQF